MKRATRLLPLLQPTSSRSSLLLRPSALPLHTTQAGPSRSLRFASSSSPRHLSNRSTNGESPNQSRLAEENEEEPELSEKEMEMIRIEAEEDVAASLAEENGLRIYSKPKAGSPIILPVSSLATDNPTQPGPEGLAISLPPQIFGVHIRRDVLHRCVIWFRSTMREGTHKVKGRSDVSFSGKKLRPQKGSGRARLADASSPSLRGGGMALYKRQRDYAQLLPRKVRAMGMRIALSTKLSMGLLRVTSNLNEGGWTKTSQAASKLYDTRASSDVQDKYTEALLSEGRAPVTRFGEFKKLSILFLYPPTKSVEEVWEFARCVRNIPGVEVMSTDEVEVYHILKFKWLVLEGGAVDTLSRMKGMGRVQGEEEGEEVTSGNEGWEDVEEVNEHEDVSSSIIRPESEETLPAVISENETSAEIYKESPEGLAHTTRIPKQYLVNRWRKIRGVKSMRRTFGTKNATTMQIRAKRTYKMLKREEVLQEGFDRTDVVDAVLREMHKRHSEEFSIRTK